MDDFVHGLAQHVIQNGGWDAPKSRSISNANSLKQSCAYTRK